MLTNTLQEKDFVEQARAIIERNWNLKKARNLLKYVPIAAWGLEERGLLLERMLKSTWQTSEQEDARYLVDYWKSILLVDSRILMQNPYLEEDRQFFANEAFVSMLQYQEVSRQGLEFVRVFLRTSLEYEAMKAHRAFTDDEWEPVTYSIPAYDALHAVLNNLERVSAPKFHAHPVWSTLIQTPEYTIVVEKMLWYLSQATELETEYLRTQRSKEPTAFELLHGIVETFISRGNLRPSGMEAVERYWKWRDLAKQDDWLFQELRSVRFAKEMLRYGGESLHLGLQHLFESPSPSLALIQAFFPLPLNHCNAQKVLYWLDRLVDERPDDSASNNTNMRKFQKAQTVMLLMKEYHNDIAYLLSTHAVLRQNTACKEYSSDAMLYAFERIATGVSGTEMEIADIGELV